MPVCVCIMLQAWNLLGLCQVSMGDIRLGSAAYERVLKMDPVNLEAWVHLAQARKEVADCIQRVSFSLVGTSVTLLLVHPRSAGRGQLSPHWQAIFCVRGHGPEYCVCWWHAGGKCGGGGEGIRARSRARQRQQPSQRTAAHAGTLPHLAVVQTLMIRM